MLPHPLLPHGALVTHQALFCVAKAAKWQEAKPSTCTVGFLMQPQEHWVTRIAEQQDINLWRADVVPNLVLVWVFGGSSTTSSCTAPCFVGFCP